MRLVCGVAVSHSGLKVIAVLLEKEDEKRRIRKKSRFGGHFVGHSMDGEGRDILRTISEFSFDKRSRRRKIFTHYAVHMFQKCCHTYTCNRLLRRFSNACGDFPFHNAK